MVRLFGLEFKAPADLEANPQYQNKHGAMMTIALDTMRETPSDNVLMQSIAGTPLGRIFMGGSDGNIYELAYQQDQPGWDTWMRPQKCQKLNHTSHRLSFLMPEMIRSVVGWVPLPIQKLVFDKSRNVSPTAEQWSRLDPRPLSPFPFPHFPFVSLTSTPRPILCSLGIAGTLCAVRE